mmetsp:Transcript_22604/g.65733  ORF Transcript_22604/g.65733 Transcript_22604/m.65733 type:complete len:224 (-) Transcript_22604:1349-2020(-)
MQRFQKMDKPNRDRRDEPDVFGRDYDLFFQEHEVQELNNHVRRDGVEDHGKGPVFQGRGGQFDLHLHLVLVEPDLPGPCMRHVHLLLEEGKEGMESLPPPGRLCEAVRAVPFRGAVGLTRAPFIFVLALCELDDVLVTGCQLGELSADRHTELVAHGRWWRCPAAVHDGLQCAEHGRMVLLLGEDAVGLLAGHQPWSPQPTKDTSSGCDLFRDFLSHASSVRS